MLSRVQANRVGTTMVAGMLVCGCLATTPVRADEAQLEQMVARAIAYLRTAQASDGYFGAPETPGITALVTAALLRHGLPPSDPTVSRSLKYLENLVQPDGGIYRKGSYYRNYETCLAIMCFTEANQDGRYQERLQRAEKFIKGLQWDEAEGHDASSMSHGGSGYGKHKRPDLSNTSYFVEALQGLGRGPDDEAMKRALIFISRCQNLESEHNTSPFAAKNPDGGFYYTVAAGGKSQADATPNGGLRSYGSMTYAGLKSMIYAGLDATDKRVKAAVKWIQNHYTLDSNPGLGDAGLYYYYHTFAKTLSTLGEERIVDSQGVAHDWRRELTAALRKRQRANGSWFNKNSRWLEGDSHLSTGYALLALSYCRPRK